MNRLKGVAWVLGLLVWPASLVAVPPNVVMSTVEDGQDDVDPALTEIRVEFDQPMDQRSYSVVGGGPSFPETTGSPRWADEKTLVIAVKLQPGRDYWMGINSDTHTGFRNRAGESAPPRPLSFATRAAGAAPADPLPPEKNREAIVILRKAIDGDYSYRDRLKLDWEKVFAQHRLRMEGAKTPNEFARAAARMLREAQDTHVYVRAGNRAIQTHINAKTPNFNIQTLRKTVGEWKEHTGGVVSGKLAGDAGYLLISQWNPAAGKGLDEAFEAVKDAKRLVIDVRMNGGGDEMVAARFAGRFVDRPKVYAKHRFRRGGQWQETIGRQLTPRDEAERYAGPVAVLIGPKVASSCESFVLMMKQGSRCKLVGETTAGASGNPHPHDLGNGVTVFLSLWECQLPDGTVLEGIGVRPDVQVKTSLGELRQRDAVLDAGIRSVSE